MKFLTGLFVIWLCAMGTPTWAEDAQGDWTGVLAGQLRLNIHIEKDGNGVYTGTLQSPTQGPETVALDNIKATPDHLAFSVNQLGGSYDGAWDDTKKSWTGFWRQGQKLPLALTRRDMGVALGAPRRPQEEAIASNAGAYRSTDVSFPGRAPGITLSGTLSLPNGKGPFPAVLLVSGSGPNTRDAEVLGHKLFLVLADSLSRRGIAVLRYDKRGVANSTGDFSTATLDDFQSDAQAAVEYMKTQQDIDPGHIGVVGHSEGGLIAPKLAVEEKSIRFVVMLAGPAIDGERLLLAQEALIAKASGEPADEIAVKTAYSKQAFDIVVASQTSDEAKTRLDTIFAPAVANGSMTKAQSDQAIMAINSPWMRQLLRYDPAPALRQLSVPVLALSGSLDLQVPPADNLPPLRDALKSNRDATISELPGLNHLFQRAKTGLPAEYGAIEETFSPTALAIIGKWVKSR